MKLSISNSGGTNKINGILGSVRNYIKNHRKITAIIVILCLAAIYGVYRFTNKTDSTSGENTAQAVATRGSIEVTVTGTGTIYPVADEEIGKNVSGTVNKIHVKNGDKVKKGDLLMEVTNDTLKLQLENAKLDLEKASINLEDSKDQLSFDTVTSPFSGRIVSLEPKTGEEVSKNSVLATLQDDSQLVFNMPVDSATAEKVYVNQKVEVFLPDQGGTVEGRIINKNSQAVSGYNGENRVYIKVAVAATGNLSSGMKAFGTVTVEGKQVDALQVSSLEWMDQTQIKATLTGKVNGVYVHEGQAVKKGQRLFALSSDSAQNQQKTQRVAFEQARLNVTDMESQLDDLVVKAPIDGIVTGMDIKEGDEIGNTSSAKASQTSSSSTSTANVSSGSLGKVINTGQMEVSFPVDEVEIAKVKIGQTANVTVDALPDQVFKGKVTEIAEEGVVTNNVGSFEVTILIDNPERLLKSGMSANITIVVAQKDNVVLIPIEALQERGQRKFVLTPEPADSSKSQNSARSWDSGKSGDPANSKDSEDRAGSAGSGQRQGMKRVTVGLTNESYAEIIEGLQEGDKILLPGQQASSARPNGMFPGMGGNRPGGSSSNRSSGSGGSTRSGGFGGMR